MTSLPLPALHGESPLGFLAALGTARLMTEHTAHRPTLAWSPETGTAALHNVDLTLEDVVSELIGIVAAIPEDGVLPGLPSDFPPPGEAPDKLRLPRPDFSRFAEAVARDGGRAAERWLSSLVTDLSVDDKGRVDITLFAAPSGKQSMRTMLDKPLGLVRRNPELLREALTSWRRYPGVSGEYLDHRVLYDATDSPNGKPAERGVPGATWLALMAYPLMVSAAENGDIRTTCWQAFPRGPKRLIYPLWSAPLELDAVRALLSHPVMKRAEPGDPPELARLLSIFRIVHASRRRLAGRTFAGVLAPNDQPLEPEEALPR
ncbi:hypothetical protein GCM10009836_23970 [Pseudonocardia ailaonensis]|uniref:Uncharacterized protein n=1 Tax=Pseudonocardia ailaonensis TaxID=367279 RepID=A0ABN2MZA6_9PSEU